MARKHTKDIIEEVLEHLGMTKREFAKRLGITEQALFKRMRCNTSLKGEDVLKIEEMTKGDFKRWYINSDIYPPEDYMKIKASRKRKVKVREFIPEHLLNLD